jgi:hypothetical protein
MMVNCPRCGFSQPQDQYCASCGVDMLAFKPAGKPFYQRVVSNTFFQIFILVAGVAVVFSFARRHRHAELADRVAEIENAQNKQILSSTSSNHGKSDLASTAAAKRQQPNAPHGSGMQAPTASSAASPPSGAGKGGAELSAAAFVANSDDAKAAGGPSGNPGGNPASGTRAHKVATNLVVTFGEISRGSLAELVSAADLNSGILQGPILSGVVPGLGARIKALHNAGQWETLDSSSHSLKAAQAVEIYGGQREESSGHFLGFVVEAHPRQLDDTESQIQLRIWRSLREGGGIDEFSVPLPDAFTVPTGSAIFISGSQILPRRTLSEAERRFYHPLKVLHLLATEEFRQGSTELLIMIEPR